MTPGPECIIEAGTVVCGVGDDGAVASLNDAGIRVQGGVIAEITPLDALAGHDDLPRHGSRGTIAMPGLVNSHHHFGLTPLMMGVPFAPLELWLPQFRAMRSVGTRLDTLYSAIEMLESGTTTVHHINSGLVGAPDNWESVTDATLSAYGAIGMRAGFSFMMRDRNILAYEDDGNVLAGMPADVRDWLIPRLAPADVPTHDYMAFFAAMKARWAEASPDHVRFHLAPANLHWCSDESLELIFETARSHGANVHMHLVETERQALFAEQRFGHSAVKHLDKLGCLGPELTLGHGNWMSRDDLDRVAECGCQICHNASSGLRLGSGIAPVNEMRRRGIDVALGIDQSNIADDRDMLLEMKLVWALHRETGLWNDRPSAAEVLQMATEHGARSVGFGGEIGRLEPGRQADMVLLSKDAVARPLVEPRTPVWDALLHRGGKSAIDKVFVGGRLVVDGGRVISVDRDAVLAEIGERLSAPPIEAEVEARAMVDRMMPYLEAFHRAHTPAASYRPYRYNAMGDA
jgi:5-methylthioadenosine/S-adenosylhomocysteine deaminase